MENAGKAISKDGIVREVEANIVFNTETAKAIRQWLDDKIKVLEKADKL